MSDAAFLCPRCPTEDDGLAIPVPEFHEPGKLAAHLIENHLVGASVALREARTAFGKAEAGPRPYRSSGSAPAPPAPKEPPMPNHTGKKKCSKCGTPGHQASTCKRGAVTRPATPRAAARPAQAAQGGSTADFLRSEIAKREREIAALRDALTVLGGSA